MFAYLNSASVYDLILDSSNVFSYAENAATFAGTLAGRTQNATLTNVVSKANLTINNNGLTTAANNKYLHIGGLVGYAAGASIKFYKCTYTGTITATPWATSLTAGIGNDCHIVGGFVGSATGSLTTFDMLNCNVNLKAVYHGGGINIAGVMGRVNSTQVKMTVKDSVITVNYTADGITTSPDIAPIGNLGTTASEQLTTSVFSNLYITWNGTAKPKTGGGLVNGWNSTQGDPASTRTTIVTNLDTTIISNATVNTNPMGAAASNSGITTYYTVSGGTATSKLNKL